MENIKNIYSIHLSVFNQMNWDEIKTMVGEGSEQLRINGWDEDLINRLEYQLYSNIKHSRLLNEISDN